MHPKKLEKRNRKGFENLVVMHMVQLLMIFLIHLEKLIFIIQELPTHFVQENLKNVN